MFVGISLHVDSRSIVLADVLGTIKDQGNLDISFSEPPDRVIGRIGELALELIERNDLKKEQIIGIALALAGKIDPHKGILKESRIYQWENLPIRDLLYAKVGVPVAIENLNNVINLAESYFGKSQNYDNILTIRVGTGYVGASLMIDGRLVRGRNSAAGLIHHVPMNATDIACECGRRGCLNTIASGFGVLARMQKRKHVKFTHNNLIENNAQIVNILHLADTGEARSKRILREGGEALGIYVAQLSEAICPEAVIIAGKIGRSRAYMDGFAKGWSQNASSDNYGNVQIIRSSKLVIEGTVEFAIDRFLLSMDLDLEPLKQVFNMIEEQVA